MFKPYSKTKCFFSQVQVAPHPEQLNARGAFERLEQLLSQHEHMDSAPDLEQQIQQQLTLINSIKNSRESL